MVLGIAGLVAVCPTVFAQGLRLTWPTPNNAYLEGRPLEDFIQPTVSGLVESGLYGCVRDNGRRFHEGVDLFPIRRDARGEALDPIVVIADGVVAHVSTNPSLSGYGRYVVVEHPDLVPAVYTLYSHLASVTPGLAAGQVIRRGQEIGILGRSAGGYTIPRERAHLHVEIGVRLSDDFDRWYRTKGFGNPNRHGNYNGMNLLGFDPLAFFDAFRENRIQQPGDFLAALPVAATVQVADRRTPDYVRRYPSLMQGAEPIGGVYGWEIDFDGSRIPLRMRPLGRSELRFPQDRFAVVRTDSAQISAWSCRSLVSRPARRGGPQQPGSDLADVLELLFGPP
jgi:murein DD-endopeptidase MepM/ murein hydrolase activator NlpD